MSCDPSHGGQLSFSSVIIGRTWWPSQVESQYLFVGAALGLSSPPHPPL